MSFFVQEVTYCGEGGSQMPPVPLNELFLHLFLHSMMKSYFHIQYGTIVLRS